MRKFQDKVLEITKRIPRGKVTTYRIIAQKLRTKAYRAVGTALRNNQHPITIPCHRVIKDDGSLGGYCGKPNSRKKAMLLKKEGIAIANNRISKEFFWKP
ncbi:MGMT family protein [Candidatus Woesearchaeota archaeon]|nr:MGMT family protein [Candidatus Woesearchaeota archaeon]